jgi:hypothetical protein
VCGKPGEIPNVAIDEFVASVKLPEGSINP